MTTSLVEWAPSKTYVQYIPIPGAGMRAEHLDLAGVDVELGADLQLTLT
jgi:hypothetical protein